METALCACGHSHASEVADVCQRVRVRSHASREKAWILFRLLKVYTFNEIRILKQTVTQAFSGIN